MEVACQLGLRNASLRANWLPRLQNEEADALTNCDFGHFSADKRVQVDLEKMELVVLDDLFVAGEDYVTELAMLNAKTKRGNAGLDAAHKNSRRRRNPCA